MNRFILGVAPFLAVALVAATRVDAAVNSIWVNNAVAGSPIIQEYDINTGALLDQITAPNGFNGRGIVQVGDVLYYTSASTNGVYAYNYVTNADLGTVFTVPGASGLATMAYDGANFYIGDYSGTNNVYKYSPTGTLLATIPLANCTGFCDGLEYANGNLVSNRSDAGNIYDVYSTTGTLLQANFITSPNSDGSTGIAFDGTHYYTDNVFDSSFNVYDTSGNYIKTVPFTGQTYFLGEDLSVNYSAVIGVPEPATWAVLILGLGAIGFAARRRREEIAPAA